METARREAALAKIAAVILALIYARAEDHCIGRGGALPWRLPEEFAHFKRTTMGRPIIMGRRTFADHQTALPGRTNIVLTRGGDFAPPPGVVVCASLAQALEPYRDDDGQVFVVGGAELFRQAFPLARRVYETIVHTRVPDGDTFVPAFDFTGWRTVTLREHAADAKHAHAFTVLRHDRG
jgi:dihydrofolate reductase